MSETVGVVAGTTIKVSATMPGTFDDDATTGYPSVSYTALGSVVDFNAGGKSWNQQTSNPISKRGTDYYRSTYGYDQDTFTVERDDDDAGAAIVQTALDEDGNGELAFEVINPDGSEDYFTGNVMQFMAVYGAADSMLQRNLTVQRTRDTVTVAA